MGGGSLKSWSKYKFTAGSVFQHTDTHGRLRGNGVIKSMKIKVLKDWEGRGKQNCPKGAQVPPGTGQHSAKEHSKSRAVTEPQLPPRSTSHRR